MIRTCDHIEQICILGSILGMGYLSYFYCHDCGVILVGEVTYSSTGYAVLPWRTLESLKNDPNLLSEWREISRKNKHSIDRNSKK